MISFLRASFVAALALVFISATVPLTANAQGYGAPPIMSARTWHTVERAGDTWDGMWTFTDDRHRTMSAVWIDRQTGRQVSSPRMLVRFRDGRVTITRPGTGDYTGTVSADGMAISGSMSWIAGRFIARVPRDRD